MHDKHLGFFLNLAETAERHLIRPEQLEWLPLLDADYENLRAALEWALNKDLPESSLRLCAALERFWLIRCYWIEGSHWIEKALAKPMKEFTPAETTALARTLYRDAELAESMDNIERMQTAAEASYVLCAAGTDLLDLAIARFYVGLAFECREEHENARSLLAQSLVEFRELNDVYWVAYASRWLSRILIIVGEQSYNEAILQNVELARKAGERLHLAEVLYNQATWAWKDQEIEKADQCFEEAEILYNQIDHKANSGSFYRARKAHFNQDYQQAKILYRKFIDQCELVGKKNKKSLGMEYLGTLAEQEGDFQQAQIYLEEALKLAEERGSEPVMGFRLVLLAEIENIQGSFERARNNFRRGLSIVRRLVHGPETICGVLLIFSRTYINLQPRVAIQIVAATHAYLQKIQYPLDPFLIRDSQRVVSQAHKFLDDAAFDSAFEEGQEMSLDNALDLALKTVEEM